MRITPFKTAAVAFAAALTSDGASASIHTDDAIFPCGHTLGNFCLLNTFTRDNCTETERLGKVTGCVEPKRGSANQFLSCYDPKVDNTTDICVMDNPGASSASFSKPVNGAFTAALAAGAAAAAYYTGRGL